MGREKSSSKINDLSQCNLRKRFLETVFVPETNYAVAMGRVSTKKQKGEAHYSDKAQLQNIQDSIPFGYSLRATSEADE